MAIRQSFHILNHRCIAILCLCLSASFSMNGYAQTMVGKATLVIGTAYIEDFATKKQLKLTSGAAIYEGRTIITSNNGHVHIRFNDQGLVSVRPNSRLIIERYDYNSANPGQSTVKFSLVRGSTRSVSGKAAQSAKKRFRMNTPIAAIGVRGTDFVIRADQKNIQAIVNEGAIVVAPFSENCSVSALGPCTVNSVVLQSDSKQFLQFNQLLATPQLLPATDQLLRDQLNKDPSDDKSAGSKNSTDSENQLAYNEKSAKKSLTGAFNPTDNTIVEIVRPVDFTPSLTVDSDQLTSKQLVWGRWGNAAASDKIAISSSVASNARKVTVGNRDFALFRTGNNELIAANLGTVSFSLGSAQVNYVQALNTSAMRVTDGFLNINFNSKVFDTGLDLQHAAIGAVNFNSSGRVDDTGIFLSRKPGNTLGGAVSLDGKEAGYFFSKDLEAGKVEGITLWEAQ